jgi:hypothetical protein
VPLAVDDNAITGAIIGAAIEVSKADARRLRRCEAWMRLSNGSRGRPARGCRVEGGGELGAYTEAVVLTYLRLSRCKVGLLINFNVAMLKDGIRRFRL